MLQDVLGSQEVPYATEMLYCFQFIYYDICPNYQYYYEQKKLMNTAS